MHFGRDCHACVIVCGLFGVTHAYKLKIPRVVFTNSFQSLNQSYNLPATSRQLPDKLPEGFPAGPTINIPLSRNFIFWREKWSDWVPKQGTSGVPKSGTPGNFLSLEGAKSSTRFGVPISAPSSFPQRAFSAVPGAVMVASGRIRPSLMRTRRNFNRPCHAAERRGGLEKYSLQCAIAPIAMASQSDTLR